MTRECTPARLSLLRETWGDYYLSTPEFKQWWKENRLRRSWAFVDLNDALRIRAKELPDFRPSRGW